MKSKKTPLFSNAFTIAAPGTESVPWNRVKLILLGAAIITLVPTLLTGCKFGNSNKITTSGYDTVSGYYATEPVSFESEVQFGSNPPRAASHPVATMPAYYRGVFSNPVMLMLQSVTTGATYLVSKDNQNYFQGTYVNQDALTFGLAEAQSLSHAGCKMTLSVSDSGSFNKDAPTVVNEITVRGRLRATREFEVSYTGDEAHCQELRDIFHLCLTDEANCPSELHVQNAEILYNSFLNAGIISTAEIKTATLLRHTSVHE